MARFAGQQLSSECVFSDEMKAHGQGRHMFVARAGGNISIGYSLSLLSHPSVTDKFTRPDPTSFHLCEPVIIYQLK